MCYYLRYLKAFYGCNTGIRHILDVLTAKIISLKHGLELAQSIGCIHGIMNSDNMWVIESMKNGPTSHAVVVRIFSDYYHLACDLIKN
jgi:hypothetical protein